LRYSRQRFEFIHGSRESIKQWLELAERRSVLKMKEYRFERKIRLRKLTIVTMLTLALIGASTVAIVTLTDKKGDLQDASAREIQGLETVVASIDSQSDVQEIEYERDTSTPYDVAYISDARQRGKGAFQNTFTSSPSKGTKLNMHVKNNNSSGTVILKIGRGTEDFGFVDVEAGKGLSKTFAMADGSGISGDWEVYVTTRDGHSMDINVNAGTIK
jgi:hypothetical protein